jgi:8-oxo-dGTP pyrophosphatase MutT (NUDIX family)
MAARPSLKALGRGFPLSAKTARRNGGSGMADETKSEIPAWLAPHGPRWRVNGKADVHDNPWFGVEVYDAVAPTGAAARYFMQVYKNVAVGVLPLHEDGTVTLVGQWRFPFGTYSWELPEGGAPHDEPPLEGGKRELREEAGLEAAEWRRILTMQLSNASSDEVAVGFLATGLSPVPHERDETEALSLVRVPFRDALAAAVAGHVQDSITVAMLLRVHHMAVEGELPDALARAVLDKQPPID